MDPFHVGRILLGTEFRAAWAPAADCFELLQAGARLRFDEPACPRARSARGEILKALLIA
jgi:hypothetical protein